MKKKRYNKFIYNEEQVSVVTDLLIINRKKAV